MLVNYTPLKRERAKDAHAALSSGMPDRAVLVYANKIRELFPGVPIVLGGIEASLRRFAHYDYWENKVRRGLLLDSRADILVYGPGELQAIEIARASTRRGPGRHSRDMRRPQGKAGGVQEIPSFEDVSATRTRSAGRKTPSPTAGPWPSATTTRYVLQYPAPEYTTADLDWVYGLPFSRTIPAHFPEFEMAQFSVVTHRGCFGHCSFCSLSLHQGDRIVSRSEASILDEIRRLTPHPDFKGYRRRPRRADGQHVRDGLRGAPCERGGLPDLPRLDRSHGRLIGLMRKARAIPGVKKVFVRSGIRYDLALESQEYIRELASTTSRACSRSRPSTSRRRCCADEQGRPAARGIPPRFSARSTRPSAAPQVLFHGRPPGSGSEEAGSWPAKSGAGGEGEKPVEGVQIFTPTPMTVSTCMYHTGRDPITGEEVYVPRTFAEKKAQKRILL